MQELAKLIMYEVGYQTAKKRRTMLLRQQYISWHFSFLGRPFGKSSG